MLDHLHNTNWNRHSPNFDESKAFIGSMHAASQQITTSSHSTTAATPLYHRVYRAGGGLERKVFDADYVNRLTQGDAETEVHFTNYFGSLLLIKLRGRLRSPQLVEDARQETFLRVLNTLRNKGGVQHPERLGAFVNAVCENVLSEFFRAGSRFQQVPENAAEPADETASAESQCLSEERKTIIRRVLVSLARPDQQILRKVFLEERDKDEICKELGIDRNYLRVRIHRALARFRTVLLKETNPLAAGTAAGG
jgi:RNA polymerase sigma-70 factor (ECF subfamily)